MKKYTKKYVTKSKTKGVTKQSVKTMIQKMDPNALPSLRSALSGRTTNTFKLFEYATASPFIIQGTIPTLAGTPVPSFGGMSFTAADLPNFAILAASYDSYRFIGVTATFKTMFNVNEGINQPVSSYMGEFLTVIDYDDSNPITTIGKMRTYNNCVITSTLKDQHRSFQPKLAVGLYNTSSLFNSYGNTSMWIDSINSNVPNFGLKWAFTGSSSTTQVPCYSLELKYAIQFRNFRST